jgi:hypothetical protein
MNIPNIIIKILTIIKAIMTNNWGNNWNLLVLGRIMIVIIIEDKNKNKDKNKSIIIVMKKILIQQK